MRVVERTRIASLMVAREEWPEGPWTKEPDRVEWKSHGFPMLIRRNSMGVLCGYVGLPPGHPLHGVDHERLPELPAHRGITFSAPCQESSKSPMEERVCHAPEPGEPDDVWWLGFDCGHAWDVAPAFLAIRPDLYGNSGCYGIEEQYRDLEYVKGLLEKLAARLAEVAHD